MKSPKRLADNAALCRDQGLVFCLMFLRYFRNAAIWVVHLKEGDQEMIIVPVAEYFATESDERKREFIAQVQSHALKLGLTGTVVAVGKKTSI